jgi:hypothetical protein
VGEERKTRYAIKQVGERYYPVVIDEEAGGHYEIKNPLTGGILSYTKEEAAKKYVERAEAKEREG